MLYLFDRDRALTVALPEYGTIVTTRRFSDESEWAGRFPSSSFDALREAYFAQVQGESELYLVEHVKRSSDDDGTYVEASGRSATALLHLRTVEGTLQWTSKPTGEIVSDLIATLTGDRALPGVTFGAGVTLGDSTTMQQSWGDMGDVVRLLLSSANLGITASLDGTDVVLDVYAPETVAVMMGEKYGNASTSSVGTDIKTWRNYAAVLGEIADDGSRVRVDVDQTDGDELRELYVDARDLQRAVTAAIPFTVATTDTFTATAHGLINENRVMLSDVTDGAPLVAAVYYWVISATENTFKVSNYRNGTAVNVTTAGSGNVTTIEKTSAQYAAVLAARGVEKLAEMRFIEYAEAMAATNLPPGALITYDSDIYSATLMCSESESTYESGAVRYDATLGEPPDTIDKSIRRIG